MHAFHDRSARHLLEQLGEEVHREAAALGRTAWVILWFLSIGLRPRTEIILPQPLYWPTWTIDAWNMIWSDWPMGYYLRNSIVAVVGSVVIDFDQCRFSRVAYAWNSSGVTPKCSGSPPTSLSDVSRNHR